MQGYFGFQKMMNTIHGTKILLPLSTLMHTYCQKQSCEQDSDIVDILNKIKANLGNDCNSSNEEKVCLVTFYVTISFSLHSPLTLKMKIVRFFVRYS